MKSFVVPFTLILLLARSNAADIFSRAISAVGQVYPSCKNTEFTALFSAFPDQYVIESHYINADDGYGLLMFRVRLSPIAFTKLPADLQKNLDQPVMLQHGLEGCSDDFFINGNPGAVGFHMVNLGYDVWLGNNRGNKYSKTIAKSNISDETFYDYSFTELGTMDQPAFFRHILSHYAMVSDQKIYYFGHSQGTSQMFVSLTDAKTRDFMNSHVKRFFALAPIAFLTEVTETGLSWISQYQVLIDDAAKLFKVWAIAENGCSKNNDWDTVRADSCKRNNFLCKDDDFWPVKSLSVNPNDSAAARTLLFQHDPSGASVKCLAHYAQMINGELNLATGKTPIFRPYSLGWWGNLWKYHAFTPPEWDLKELKAPLSMLMGVDDALGTEANTQNIADRLNPGFTWDKLAGYDHLSFLISVNPKLMLDVIDRELAADKLRDMTTPIA